MRKRTSRIVWILLGVVVLMSLCCITGILLIRSRRVKWLENWRQSKDNAVMDETENTDNLDTEAINEEYAEKLDDLWTNDTEEAVDNADENEGDEGDGESEGEPDSIPDEETIDPPVAPSELRFAEFMPVDSVTLIWNDNSHNKEGFRIQRLAGPTRVTAPNITQVIYSDSPACGETYRYRVYGYNDGGKSGYSNIISFEGRCP